MLLALLPVRLSATDFVYDGITYTILSENAKTVETQAGYITTKRIPGNTVSGELVLPETVYNGNVAYKIVKIGDYGFCDQADLTKVVLPDDVIEIGELAFVNCANLTSIELPGVVKLDRFALGQCSSLTSVELPLLETMDGQVFNSCTNLTSVVAPKLTKIEYDVFQDCHKA